MNPQFINDTKLGASVDPPKGRRVLQKDLGRQNNGLRPTV